MTGRLPHRVSDALSTKTDRSYVSPSPKNSLSFQELPHNQSKQTDQNPRWNCPWQPSNNGILAVPIQTHTNTANMQRLWNLSKTKQSKHHPHLPRQDLNPNTTTNNTTTNNATICLFIFHNFIILHKKQKQRNQKAISHLRIFLILSYFFLTKVQISLFWPCPCRGSRFFQMRRYDLL